MDNNKELTPQQSEKLDRLKADIAALKSLAVGFSGGVDSTFLLMVAHDVLGDKAIAVTEADSSVPEREIKEAEEFCRAHGILQIICNGDQINDPEYRKNGPDRCYHCKRRTFTKIMEIAKEHGIEYVAEGSNMDDLGDYRPGLKAVGELKVKSPLREAGLSKADIRALSKAMGLKTWSKPSYACLASRFAYGEEITVEKLKMIDKAEQFLIERGFIEERVRIHGNVARIEVRAEDIPHLAEEGLRQEVYNRFKEIGFMFVALDMRGYKSGSMNAAIGK